MYIKSQGHGAYVSFAAQALVGLSLIKSFVTSQRFISPLHSTGAANDLSLYKRPYYFYKLFFHAARSS